MKPEFANQKPSGGGQFQTQPPEVMAIGFIRDNDNKQRAFNGPTRVDLEQPPRARLKRRRKKQKLPPEESKEYFVGHQVTATAILLVLFCLILVNASEYHSPNGQPSIRAKWPAAAAAMEVELEPKVETTATGLTEDRNDDIAMINERLLVQDTAGGKSSWRPVDVDVGNEINQYEQIQEAAPWPEDTNGRAEGVARVGKTQEFQNGTGARSKRTAVEITSAPTMAAQSDGSPEMGLDTTSNKTGERSGQQDNLKCRLEKDLYMEFERYKHYACANCYSLLPPELFTRKLIFEKKFKGLLRDGKSDRLVMPNETDLIRATFTTERTFNLWQQCCEHAIDCCRKNSVSLPKTKNSSTGQLIDDDARRDVCPATWDGFSCWPESPAGLVAKHDCPLHVYFLEFMPICAGQVTKQCFANGSWYVRNGHEWSNFSKCDGLEVYTHRMLIGSGLHLFSVIVIGPALLILGRMRQRFGTRRVRILRWLLFWLLLNGLFSATQKIGIILKVFDKPVEAPARNQTAYAAIQQENKSAASLSNNKGPVRASSEATNETDWQQVGMSLVDEHRQQADAWMQKLDSSRSKYDRLAQSENTLHNERPIISQAFSSGAGQASQSRARRMLLDQSASQSADKSSGDKQREHQQSFLMVLLCWTVSVGIKITRLFGYAWMFTSAVYLCSVLHFSPAEPPALFMSWLMFSTNAFPVVIGTIYVAVRSIYDPSPLTLLFTLPYHYVQGDMDYVNYLKDTQLDCWMVTSKFDRIEDIADWPYLALVLLNTALFVITLIIMCRFKKLPGSTRPETSLWGYFKAAGMLVFLYGAHYLLLAYTPKVEGCAINQVWHYAMLLVDGIQGVAISLVFCYKTSAGKEVICKWWKNVQDEHDCHCCINICRRPRKQANRQHRSLLKQSSRSNRSTGSGNSNCNGKEMFTELSNVNVNNF